MSTCKSYNLNINNIRQLTWKVSLISITPYCTPINLIAEVHSLRHLSLATRERLVVVADLVLSELRDLVGHVGDTGSETDGNQQQCDQQTQLNREAVVGGGSRRGLGAAVGAAVTLIAVAVGLLGDIVKGTVTVRVTQSILRHFAFLTTGKIPTQSGSNELTVGQP